MFFSPTAFHRATRNTYGNIYGNRHSNGYHSLSATPISHALASSLLSSLNSRESDRFWSDSTPTASTGLRVEKDDTSVTLYIDIPGLAKDQLTVAIEADTVRIESKADALRSFKAAYQLAQEIDASASTASVENGVLTLKLGKLVPVSRETVLTVN